MSLEKIMKLHPVEYTYKQGFGDSERLTMSVMAQELNEIWPVDEYTLMDVDENGYLKVSNPHQLIFPLMKAVQEMKLEIEELKNELQRD